LASQLEPIDLEEGITLIRQGDAGDRFYVLEKGSAQVEVDGTIVATCAPGDGFGEIALLHDVPRTATVRIVAPSRVMALDRAHFLSVLIDEPMSMIEAERLAANRLLATAAAQRRQLGAISGAEQDDRSL
jgi:CRP-like cAMP-binding protein